MNTRLIADAVRNTRSEDQSSVWDKLFAFWFRRLVYTQIWEDPEADLAALQLPVGSTIVTISSGGTALGRQPGGADAFGQLFAGPQSADIRFVGIESAGQALQHAEGAEYPQEALQ